MNNYYVYIISNWNNKVTYIGVTNNLERRIYEHKNKLVDGFTKKYNISKLVYYEQTSEINSAIAREKEIKKWRREKKNQLIESLNPEWKDLAEDNKGKISQSSEKDALVRNDSHCVVGLIIAAGLSSRMGHFKPLMEWNGKTFLSSIIDKLNVVCNNIVIVTGNESEKIEKYVSEQYSSEEKKINCVLNPNYLEGMFTSIIKGVEQANNSEWIFFHQVDQPNLPEEFYFDFINQINKKYDWIQPTFKGQKGHPIIFGRKVIRKIISSTIDSNLRIVANSPDIIKKYWECNYPEILTDLDTPADLNKIKGKK